MALSLKDRCKQKIATNAGTGSVTLTASVKGFKTISSTLSNGDTSYFCLESANGDWEVFVGAYTASGTTISRDTVLASSNSGNKIDIGTSITFCYIVYPADKSVYKDGSGRTVVGSSGLIFSDSSVQTTAATTPDLSSYAPLASPTFTGVPSAPTAAGGTNTTQIATTQFVTSAVGAIDLSGYVPYTGATGAVNLGSNALTVGTSASVNNSGLSARYSLNVGTSSFAGLIDSEVVAGFYNAVFSSNNARVSVICGSGGEASLYLGDYSTTRVKLTSSAAGILEQRDSTTAQTFRLAETWTSATSFGALQFKANSGAAYQIGSAIGSAGGTNSDISLGHFNSAGTFTAGLTITTNSQVMLPINKWVLSSESRERFYLSSTATYLKGPTIIFRGDDNSEFLTISALGSIVHTPVSSTTGSPTAFTLTGAAHTSLTASTEATDVNFNLARTVQFATGALTTQRAMRIQAPTYSFVGASTITTASTLSISGPPIAGTNATITKPYALHIESGELVVSSASATSSRMTEWIVGGTTRAYVRDDGYFVATIFDAPGGYIATSGAVYCTSLVQGGSVTVLDRAGQFLAGNTTLKSNVGIEIQPNSAYNVTSIVNSTNAQTFRVVGTFTSTTAYELINIKGKASANFEIGPENGSAGGTLRGLTIGCYPAGTATIVGWAQFRPNTSTGALEAFYLGPIADSTATGGNARGQYAVDLQLVRSAANQVASGVSSFCSGQYNIASGAYSTAVGYGNTSGPGSLTSGFNNSVTGNWNGAIGYSNTVTGGDSGGCFATGKNNTISVSSSQTAFVTGYLSSVTSNFGFAHGVYGSATRLNQYVHGGDFGFVASVLGGSQYTRFVVGGKTTSSTPVNLMLDSSTTRLTIPSGKTMTGFLIVKGIKSDGSAKARFVRLVDITNVGGTTALDTPIEAIGTDYNPSACVLAVTAEDATDDLQINITGPDGETWRWVATFNGLEIAYGS